MLLADLTATSAAVAATSSRLAKAAAIAERLRAAAPDEVALAVGYLAGELRQRRTGLGYATVRSALSDATPAPAPSLTLRETDTAFERIAAMSGPGSQTGRRQAFAALLRRATGPEQRLLAGLVTGELRQGASDGVMTEAVARAAGLPAADVRRAVMVRGAAGPVAVAVLERGAAALGEFALVVGRPVQPMLAQTADSVADALSRTGPAAVEWKLDGVRVQVHRDGDDVRVFTRTLDDITSRVPEVVEAARSLPVRAAVLDGEAIALHGDGRPRPFQETGSRVGSRVDVRAARAAIPLSTFFFDVLHVDGADLLGASGRERYAALARLVPESLRVPRVELPAVDDDAVTRGAAAATAALAAGHEGVVVKALDAPYEAGRRGAAWVKVKPRHTLDLVVLGAEWGSGRRRGWLSNLHLGARDPAGRYGEPGGFVMLGKTFKGLTDAMLGWQTERLLQLVAAGSSREDWAVMVRPELVVEVAFDGVQRSSRYPAGVALRFARVLRHRDDKRAVEADTVDDVLATLPASPDATADAPPS